MRARLRGSFYGWRIVVFGALGLALTAPGQTVGVSVFVDELIAALDLTRSEVSLAYLVGTLTGALAMPVVGRWVDRHGIRVVMAGVGVGFGAALAGMSAVVGFASLIVGFTGIRMLGQGSLSLVATTSVALWFERRRGLAIGLAVASGGALMSLAPLLLVQVIGVFGWRQAWVVTGVVVGSLVVAVALLGMRNRPEDVGQRLDGEPPETADARPSSAHIGWTRGEAMRTLMFWAVTGGVAAVGLIGTGMQFHQISLLGEQGLTTTQAAANFVPQTFATIVATIAAGWLADRLGVRNLVVASMVLLVTGMLLVQIAAPGWLAILYALCIGSAGGAMRALEGAAFPRFFGLAHVGSIRGTVMAINVGATAFGPLALARGFETTGSYAEALLALLVLPVVVIGLVWFARVPDAEQHAVVRARVDGDVVARSEPPPDEPAER